MSNKCHAFISQIKKLRPGFLNYFPKATQTIRGKAEPGTLNLGLPGQCSCINGMLTTAIHYITGSPSGFLSLSSKLEATYSLRHHLFDPLKCKNISLNQLIIIIFQLKFSQLSISDFRLNFVDYLTTLGLQSCELMELSGYCPLLYWNLPSCHRLHTPYCLTASLP